MTDSDKALLDFFGLGVDYDWKIIGNGGQVDKELPKEVLEEVRTNVELIDLRGAKNFAQEFGQIAKELKVVGPFAKPQTFPKTPPTIETFPSEFSGFVIRRQTILEAWREILWTVMTFGHTSPTDYGLEQKEVVSLLSVIEDPIARQGKLPRWSPFRRKDVDAYIRRFFDREKSEEVAYGYGNRLLSYWDRNQVELLVAELQRSRHSRRALANLWDPVGDSRSADPPCITTIQAMVRDGRLHLITYIRSNDMFRAYPLNAFALARLQAMVAEQLDGVRMGSLMILSLSAHIYSDCWDVCQKASPQVAKLHKRFEQDPRGSFVFRYENGQFVADHYSPNGDLVQTFRADDHNSLMQSIEPFVSRADHGIYLGKEINRFARAVKTGQRYEQDKVK